MATLENLIPLKLAPFSEWEYGDAENALKSRLPGNYGVLHAYAVERDHLQKSRSRTDVPVRDVVRGLVSSKSQWIGPGDAGSEKVEQQYAPDDVIGTGLSNIADAFMEAQVGCDGIVSPPEGEPQDPEVVNRITEADDIITDWWDKRGLQELVHSRLKTSAWAGFAAMRLWIPLRFMARNPEGEVFIRNVQGGDTPADRIRRAMSCIHVNAPEPDECGVYTDSETQDRCAIYLSEETTGVGATRKTYKKAELVYLDPDREGLDEEAVTYLRVVYSDPDKTGYNVKLPLAGYLLFAEMVTESILTDPVLRSQRQLNFLSTIPTRMGETAAFRGRYLGNTKPQGRRVPYEDGDEIPEGAFLDDDEVGKTWLVIPTERTLGASTTTELVGLPKKNEKGDVTGYETVQVVLEDPVDPGPYLNAADKIRNRILRMFSQGHLGGESGVQLSGIAYEQARAAFGKDLNKRRVPEEGMLRNLLTAALVLAEIIADEVGYFTDYVRVTVEQHVNPGPRSPDAARVDMDAYEMGLLSEETTQAGLGVEDTVAEAKRIRSGTSYSIRMMEKVVPLAALFTTISIRSLLERLRVPKAIVDVLVPKPDAPKPTDAPPK
jgi:hypothetical protein